MDINTKKLKKNAFRVSKVRGETASRVRIPGGYINAESLQRVVEIAEKYGNGQIFITNRQGIEISAPEEIAYINGWITKETLLESAQRYGKSPYGEHLKQVAAGKVRY